MFAIGPDAVLGVPDLLGDTDDIVAIPASRAHEVIAAERSR
ncbi:hypothetical protein P9869_35220 [Streptomyces ossamyceticus]|nr:hypothetical protein [Streptomyces ossamyceticus]